MNTFELMPTEENLIWALNEDILQRNKDLVYFYDLLMAQQSAGTIEIGRASCRERVSTTV